MALNFIKESITIGADKITDKTFTFFKQGFRLNGAIGEPEYRDVTVSGVDSLTLPNAEADGLNYCKLYGKCEQRNLPEGYTEVEYLQSSGTQLIDTGIKLNYAKDFRIKGTIINPSSNKRKIIIGNYTTENNSSFSLEFATNTQTGLTANGIRVFFGNLTTNYYSSSTDALPINTNIDIDFAYTASTKSFTLNCVANGQTYTLSGNATDNPGVISNETICLFLDKRADKSSIKNSLTIKSMSFEQDTINKNFIPSKNSSNELGMYDTVTNTFLTNAGTGTFTAGNDVVPTPTRPLNIICNNGVVKVSPNLFDKNGQYIAGFVNSDTGVLSASTEQAQQRSFVIPCLPNTTYVLQGMTANSTWGSFTSSTIGTRATSYVTGNTILTTGSNDKYLIGLAYTASGLDYRNTLQIETGTTPTAYRPYKQVYIDGTTETVKDSLNNTATAENLYKLDNTFVDVQSVIDGVITRKVGVKVFDGTEDWTYDSANIRFILQIPGMFSYQAVRTTPAYCTHYLIDTNGTPFAEIPNNTAYIGMANNQKLLLIQTTDYNTTTDFKNYLANQYANGTPVVIVYPLETATTSTVTAQTLTTKKGTNTIEITQASLTGLPLEVSYKAGVTVTITQIENANLDNQVTVTIGE